MYSFKFLFGVVNRAGVVSSFVLTSATTRRPREPSRQRERLWKPTTARPLEQPPAAECDQAERHREQHPADELDHRIVLHSRAALPACWCSEHVVRLYFINTPGSAWSWDAGGRGFEPCRSRYWETVPLSAARPLEGDWGRYRVNASFPASRI